MRLNEPFIVCSYYTPLYMDYTDRLKASLDRHGLSSQWVVPVACTGSWQANTLHKASFLLAMRSSLSGPIVWLDADAEVKKAPVLLSLLAGRCDVAAHRRFGVELLSGTVWLNDTPAAFRLLQRWEYQNGVSSEELEQRNLAAAIHATGGVRFHRLPVEYCAIFDGKEVTRRGVDPVILQHQASRSFKECLMA